MLFANRCKRVPWRKSNLKKSVAGISSLRSVTAIQQLFSSWLVSDRNRVYFSRTYEVH